MPLQTAGEAARPGGRRWLRGLLLGMVLVLIAVPGTAVAVLAGQTHPVAVGPFVVLGPRCRSYVNYPILPPRGRGPALLHDIRLQGGLVQMFTRLVEAPNIRAFGRIPVLGVRTREVEVVNGRTILHLGGFRVITE